MQSMSDGRYQAASGKALFLFHWFMCGVGLLGIIYGLSVWLHAVLTKSEVVYEMAAVPFFFPDKRAQLFFIVGGMIALFLYYWLAYLIIWKRTEWMARSYSLFEPWSKQFIFLYVATPLIVNVIVIQLFPSKYRHGFPISGYLLVILWLGVLVLPLYNKAYPAKEKFLEILDVVGRHARGRLCQYVVGGVLVFACAQLATIFLPYLQGKLLIMNEYMDIPEYTRMTGKYVSNTEFINSHELGGLLKYDLERDHGNSPFPRPGTFAELPHTETLRSFIGKNNTKYYYNENLNALVIQGPMTFKERVELEDLLDDLSEPRRDEFKRRIHLLYGSSGRELQFEPRKDIHLEQEFLEENQLEMHWQILDRAVMHHHNFVLGPINEYALGKPLKDISAQYGLPNVLLMKYLLEKTGGITYSNYFQKWYSFWPLYYVMFIGLAIVLLRDVYYVTLVCLLAFGFVNMTGHHFLLIGPGNSPIRHLFDIPVAACLYFYLKLRRSAFLGLGLLGGVVGVLNNTPFGLFLVAALCVTVVVEAFHEKGALSVREAVWVGLAVVMCGMVMMAGDIGKNSLMPHYLNGYLSFPLSKDKLLCLMISVSGSYLTLLAFQNSKTELRYVSLFFLLYSQGLLLYSVWGGTKVHMLNIAPVLVLGVVVLTKLIIDSSQVKQYEKILVQGLILVALGAVYIPGLFAYYSEKTEYENNFVNHKTYEWNFETAKFRSTMDPKYFEDSVALIREYSQSQPGIHLISKYDSILPFLARKYSAMPFFDLKWFLLTSDEINLSVKCIKSQKPQYLFVDSDLERNFNGEILVRGLPPISTAEGESLMRVQRLNLLKKVFAAVKDDYELEMSRGLLTVYKRKISGEMEKLS